MIQLQEQRIDPKDGPPFSGEMTSVRALLAISLPHPSPFLITSHSMTRLKAKSKGKSTEITRRTTRSLARLYQSCLKIPTVPDDVFQSILDIIKADGDYKTLTSIARTNHAMYDLVIPMIYGVVVFNQGNCTGKNRKMIGFGHGSGDNIEKPTRKDVATSFTRKLIFACMPDIPISRSYRAINEVVIQREDTEETWPPNACDHFMWSESRFNRYLRIIGPAISLIDSLHVKVQPSCRSVRNDDKMNALYQCFDSAIQCTYELTVPLCYETTAVSIAYDLQCVVTFAQSGQGPERGTGFIASYISDCFEDEDLDTPTGQLFIRDLPHVVLNPQELASASDLNEAAITKICDLVSVYPDLTGSIYKTKLDFFKSRIKLVKSGFKPTLADLYPRPQPRRGLSSVLLPEGFVPVPDDPWSLTDDEPMESEAEYSGSETSGPDSDSEIDERWG